jgi:nitrogen fixation-related uncharacterized protein
MKILCLFVILVNVFVFLWGYRNHAFTDPKPKPHYESTNLENIMLLDEAIKANLYHPPEQVTEEQLVPYDQDINQSQPYKVQPSEFGKIPAAIDTEIALPAPLP